MKPDIGTGDIIVGVLGAIGVIVLLVLFIYVVRNILTKKEGE
jgi:beta-lactamase regulating signal transducer with metallopeptidase domain